MAVVLEPRNPSDLTTTYNQIEIERGTISDGSDMANITTVNIDTTTASDLSTGYTGYTDSSGTEGTHYYRFRYKQSSGGAVSSYSDIFLAGGSVLQARFRRLMRDVNANNYYFSNDDLKFFEEQAIEDLWPMTWTELYLDTFVVGDGATEVFNFPVGVTRVNKVDVLDSNGQNTGKRLNWQVRGKILVFDEAPPSGFTYRVWVEKMFLKLAEVPDVWDLYLLNKMRLQAYETFEGDRTKYYKYTSVAQPEGGNLPSIGNIIARIEKQLQIRENKLRRVRRAQDIHLV